MLSRYAIIFQMLGAIGQLYYWYLQAYQVNASPTALWNSFLQMAIHEQVLNGAMFVYAFESTLYLLTGWLPFKCCIFYPVGVALIYLDYHQIIALINAIEAGTWTVHELAASVGLVARILSLVGIFLNAAIKEVREEQKIQQ